MIKSEDGRDQSVLEISEVESYLYKELKRLSPEERAAFLEMVNQSKEGTVDLVQNLEEQHYERVPVDLKTFLFDDYYMGEIGRKLYPVYVDDLEEIFSGNYNEIIFTGAIGIGKTWVCALGIARVLYELSCLRNPQESFNLSPDTSISIVGFSANEDLAKEVVLKNVVEKLAQSPYFRETFPYKPTQKVIRFPKNIVMYARSTTPRSALGLSPIAAIIDESNFMPNKSAKASAGRHGSVDMAKTIYDTITRRLQSRYGKWGKLFLPSSKATQDSFLAQRIAASRDDPSIFVRDYAIWEAKPADYSSKKFWVLCGNEQVSSSILTDEKAKEIRSDLPERTVLVHVPEDLRGYFEQDLEGSLRDQAGVSTVAMSPFIQRREALNDMLDTSREHPFTHQVWDPSSDVAVRWDLLSEEVSVRDSNGLLERMQRPLLHPNAPRHIHFDPALNNCSAGMCMGHVYGSRIVERRTQDMKVYREEVPIFWIDVILEIVPPLAGELDFAMYREFVYAFSQHGFHVHSVSMDQWQSIETLQALEKAGYRVSKASMDKSWNPYQVAKAAMYEKRVVCYYYAPLLNQLRNLEADWPARKVLKPANGLKDVADAFAGTVFSLLKMPVLCDIPILKGMMEETDRDNDNWVLAQEREHQRGLKDSNLHPLDRDSELASMIFGGKS